MVSSRCVEGLSTGIRAFSASSTMVNATAVKARLGLSAKDCADRRSAIRGRAVVAQVSDTTKITTSNAGSARNPIIISRRAPNVPNAVPTSIAAKAKNTRAVARRPTSAIASACVIGKRVASEGMTAAAASGAVPVLAQLDRLEALLAGVDPADPDGPGRATVASRLESLLRRWQDRGGVAAAGGEEPDKDWDQATDDELFQALDEELGVQ